MNENIDLDRCRNRKFAPVVVFDHRVGGFGQLVIAFELFFIGIEAELLAHVPFL